MRSVVCIFFFVFFVVYRALAARRSPLGWPCWYVVRKEGGGTQFDAWFCTPFFPDDPFLLWLRHRRLHPALPPRLGRVHPGGAAGIQRVSHINFFLKKSYYYFSWLAPSTTWLTLCPTSPSPPSSSPGATGSRSFSSYSSTRRYNGAWNGAWNGSYNGISVTTLTDRGGRCLPREGFKGPGQEDERGEPQVKRGTRKILLWKLDLKRFLDNQLFSGQGRRERRG